MAALSRDCKLKTDVRMSLTLCLCSSVINGSLKSSSLGFGVRLDPGVRPTSPLNLIINKNFNSDTALNSYWLISNPPQYSLFALPPPHPLNFVSHCFQNDTLGKIQSSQEHSKTVLHLLPWRETLKFLWFLLGRIIFLTREKNSVPDSTACVIFLTCEKHRSFLWLARTHLHMKIYDIALHWVYLSGVSIW